MAAARTGTLTLGVLYPTAEGTGQHLALDLAGAAAPADGALPCLTYPAQGW
jgi:hypothetical protein